MPTYETTLLQFARLLRRVEKTQMLEATTHADVGLKNLSAGRVWGLWFLLHQGWQIPRLRVTGVKKNPEHLHSKWVLLRVRGALCRLLVPKGPQ